jgi:hypothetical protein
MLRELSSKKEFELQEKLEKISGTFVENNCLRFTNFGNCQDFLVKLRFVLKYVKKITHFYTGRPKKMACFVLFIRFVISKK